MDDGKTRLLELGDTLHRELVLGDGSFNFELCAGVLLARFEFGLGQLIPLGIELVELSIGKHAKAAGGAVWHEGAFLCVTRGGDHWIRSLRVTRRTCLVNDATGQGHCLVLSRDKYNKGGSDD